MKKLLYIALVLFLVIDVFLAYTYFGNKKFPFDQLKARSGSCKILEQKFCNNFTLTQLGATTYTANFNLPRDTVVYAPVDGSLSMYVTPQTDSSPGETVFYLDGSDGYAYYFLFDPITAMKQVTTIKMGDSIGVLKGTEIKSQKGASLSVTVKKDGLFSKDKFNTFFKK